MLLFFSAFTIYCVCVCVCVCVCMYPKRPTNEDSRSNQNQQKKQQYASSMTNLGLPNAVHVAKVFNFIFFMKENE